METKPKHIRSLLGRIFIISNPENIKSWGGDVEVDCGEIDYESLENFISYEEGDLTSFAKTPDSVYYLYFAMSSKVEVFSLSNGLVICDGLYSNASWDYSKELHIKTIAKIDLEVNVAGEAIYIFDAALDGQSALLSITTPKEWQDSIKIDSLDGFYSVSRVEVTVFEDDQEIVLMGIMICR